MISRYLQGETLESSNFDWLLLDVVSEPIALVATKEDFAIQAKSMIIIGNSYFLSQNNDVI